MKYSKVRLYLAFYFWLLALGWLISGCAARPQLSPTLRLTQVPAATPTEDNIYLAGSFNNWNPADPDYKMHKIGAGQYQFVFSELYQDAAYKFTRGSWQTVETDSAGNDLPNRKLDLQHASQLQVAVQGWKDQLQARQSTASTAAANVQVLDTAFAMPQLGRQRRIWLYLPPDYTTSDKRYPVIYMHDGQNLFDKASAFSGEWGVDETLNQLFRQGHPGVIVVGIDNGGAHRIPEYAPWENKEYGGGEGDAYLRFIVENLKPYIDSHYRTMPGQQQTALAGSSLGALISLYGAMEYPQVFGRIGLFSPALWFNAQMYDYVKQKADPAAGQRFYFMASQQESSSMVPDMQRVCNLLEQQGVPGELIYCQFTQDGAHSEWYWQREFPKAFQWLFP